MPTFAQSQEKLPAKSLFGIKRQERNEFKINGRHLLRFERIPKTREANSTQKVKSAIFLCAHFRTLSPTIWQHFRLRRGLMDDVELFFVLCVIDTSTRPLSYWHSRKTSTMFIMCASLLLSHYPRSADQFNQKKSYSILCQWNCRQYGLKSYLAANKCCTGMKIFSIRNKSEFLFGGGR